MLKIFVCEDDISQRQRITKYIKNSILIERFDMEVALSTGNPNEIINYCRENANQGVYFLDIDLKSDINGIILASEIRNFDPLGFIIFITTHSELTHLTFKYKVEAMDYIIKDDFNKLSSNIHQCIKDVNSKYYLNSPKHGKKFNFKINNKVINIDYNDILFFETASKARRIVIHALDRQIEFYALISDIEKKVDERFYRCHKSYLVNKDNIREIDFKKRIIYMIDGQECLISMRQNLKLMKSNFNTKANL
ncbi:MAG: LytR/AlgR family response regulator transcription factor [Clostridiaceae bacterium]